MRNVDFERMAEQLEESGQYKVLRRLVPPSPTSLRRPLQAGERIAILLDCETTGLYPELGDEICRLTMVPVIYANDRIVAVLEQWDRLLEPSIPIPAAATAIHGITDEMCRGQVIEASEVAAFVGTAAIVIAHNARFDRAFAEKHWPDAFIGMPWACSLSQINWAVEGFEGAKLSYLATQSGFFYERHDSLDDCFALLALLQSDLPRCGKNAMTVLLAQARRPTKRLYAVTPYEAKDRLRQRGWRWSSGNDGKMKAWYRDCDPDHLDAELAWLTDEICSDALTTIVCITARERFSVCQ